MSSMSKNRLSIHKQDRLLQHFLLERRLDVQSRKILGSKSLSIETTPVKLSNLKNYSS